LDGHLVSLSLAYFDQCPAGTYYHLYAGYSDPGNCYQYLNFSTSEYCHEHAWPTHCSTCADRNAAAPDTSNRAARAYRAAGAY
jgi:hypothetical protein